LPEPGGPVSTSANTWTAQLLRASSTHSSCGARSSCALPTVPS
jgi:hypothetical protein